MKYLLPILLLLSLHTKLTAQDATATTDSSEVKRFSAFGLPLIFSSPETRLGIGAVGIFTLRFKGSDLNSRPSQIQVGTAYTLNKQILFYIPFRLYFKNEKYLTYGELGYYKYNYFFHGIGNDQKPDFEELFDVNYPRIRLNALYQLNPKTYIGLRYHMDDYDVKTNRLDPEGQLITATITGSQGGFISGIGAVANYDSRDNIFYPTDGFFIEVATLLNAKATGSNFEYTKLSIDAATFLQNKWNHILGLHFYSEFTGGDAPFNELSLLGGNRRMRGYYQGRYRDNHFLTLQAEYRLPLFWRIGGVVFAGYGGVADKVNNFDFNEFRLAYGAGLRIKINNEGLNVRIDYGIGGALEEETPVRSSGFYLTIGEAF